MVARASESVRRDARDKARKKPLSAVVCLICVPLLPLGLSDSVLAADWTTTGRLTLREVYTDNVRLAPPGDEESDFVTDVNPGISVRGRGRRLELNFDYSPQAIFRARDNSTDIDHRLQGDATAELVEQRFFLDLRSTVAQTNLTNTGRRASDNITRTGNRIDTFTYSVSPYVRQRFGSFADGLARYTYDEVINEGDAVDSRSNRVNVEIASGSDFNRLRWSAAYDGQRIENRDGTQEDETEFQSVEGTLRYVFNRQFSIFGSGGWEDNDFESTQDTDGTFWRAGATWTPSRRTTVEGSYGERFFDKFFAASLRHRSRRTVWRASFDEDTSTTRQVQLERVLVPLVDPFGNPIVDPLTGAQIAIPLDIETLTDEVIVRRRFEGSVAIQGLRTTVTLRGFHEERDFQRTGDEETVVGASADLSRRLSQHTTFNLSGRWDETDFRDDVREDTRWSAAVSLRHEIGPSINGVLEYRRQEQDSNFSENDFTENRVSAILSVTF